MVVLFSPAANLTPGLREALTARAEAVEKGMITMVDKLISAGTSKKTKRERPLTSAIMRTSFMASDPIAYASACRAIAVAEEPEYSKITAPTVIVAGMEDLTCPRETVDFLVERIRGSKSKIIPDSAHWLP